MKYRKIFIVALALLFAAASLGFARPAAGDKLGLEDFLNFLKKDQDALQYKKYEKTSRDELVVIKIFCTEVTQRRLIEVIDNYDTEKYYFEMNTPDNILFFVEFAGAGEGKKSKCPGKVKVLSETIAPQTFSEYAYFSGQVQIATVALKSPIAGTVKDVRVNALAAVLRDDVLLVIGNEVGAEIRKLEEEVATRKKVLMARQNWQDKSAAAIKSAEAALLEAQALLAKKRAELAMEIKSPIDGTVKSIQVVKGAKVAEGLFLLEIVSEKTMKAEVTVDPADLAGFNRNETVFARFKNVSEAVTGTIASIGANSVVVSFDNSLGRIAAGDEFTFRKFRKEYSDAIVVANACIGKDEVGNFAYLVDGKRARKVYVTTGAVAEDKTLILSGLVAGNEMIVSELDCLRDGKRIRLMKKAEEAKAAEIEKPQPEIEKPKPEVEEAPAVAGEEKLRLAERFSIGIFGDLFNLSSKDFKDRGYNTFQPIPGFNLGVRVTPKYDVWLSYAMYSSKGATPYVGEEITLKIVPISVGARRRLAKMTLFKQNVQPFVGVGIDYYAVKEIYIPYDIYRSKNIGLYLQAGSYFDIGKVKFLRGQIFLKYNLVWDRVQSEIVDPYTVSLMGFEIGLGLDFIL